MKHLLIPALLAALIAGCSSTPPAESGGAPVEGRDGSSGIAKVTAGSVDGNTCPDCGRTTVRTGSCTTCPFCGYNSGCG